MEYVEHQRYGSRPRITGLDVDPDDPDVFLHWSTGLLSQDSWRVLEGLGVDPDELGETAEVIPGTAVVANLEIQTPATVAVTHYYDIARPCRDCDRMFIFFAVEQKRWYEELNFPLEADCVRCYPCRAEMRALQKLRFRYEELVGQEELDEDEHLELALCRLELVEERVFGGKQASAIRAFLNKYPDHPQGPEIRFRVEQISPHAIGDRLVKGRRRPDPL